MDKINTSFLSSRCLIVAEIGINHRGEKERAWEMIRIASECGADYIKLQSFKTEKLLHPSVPYYRQMQGVELSEDDQRYLFEKAAQENIPLFSTPFDSESLALLETFSPPAYKIASMDANNPRFVEQVAQCGKPLFIATGLASMEETEKLLRRVQKFNNKVFLLHCVSDYPARPEDMNLAMMQVKEKKFHVPVGLSDHTIGTEIAKTAITMGAKMVEKHFTLNAELQKEEPFSDHAISMNPRELLALREFAEQIPTIRGDGEKRLTEGEKNNLKQIRRGIYASKEIKAGEIFTEENLITLRPEGELPVSCLDELIGKTAKKSYAPLSEITQNKPA